MSPTDVCSICNGSTWVLVGDRHDHCDCWKNARAKKRVDSLQIPARYWSCDLTKFELYENERLTLALKAAQRFAETFPQADPREQKGLFFIGRAGIGKTHLAAALLKHAVVTHSGTTGLFCEVPELLKAIRESYNPATMATEAQILGPVTTVDLLVLDDMGAERTSLWVEETLNLIVNTRYNHMRTTIFTSNYEVSDDLTDPDCLQVRVGFRMFSRLQEMCEFVEFDGADYRERPRNHNARDLETLWALRRGTPAPPKRNEPLFGGDGDGKADLKWPGGRAGNT